MKNQTVAAVVVGVAVIMGVGLFLLSQNTSKNPAVVKHSQRQITASAGFAPAKTASNVLRSSTKTEKIGEAQSGTGTVVADMSFFRK